MSYGDGGYGEGLYGSSGVPFFANFLADAFLSIEAAWGADLLGAPADWIWYDITEDVRQSDGAAVEIVHGRSDEASTTQPATCQLLLDNSSGKYSLGGQSSLYPYVRQNTPIRVRVTDGVSPDYVTLFQGYADSWTPTWQMTGAAPSVALSASGVLRRISQRSSPIMSSMRRRLTTETNVVAYWSCEDGKGSTYATSELVDYPPLLWTVGTPNFAASDAFDASLSLPTLTDSALDGFVPSYSYTGQWQVRMLAVIPEAGLTDGGNLMRIYLSGAIPDTVELTYHTGGVLSLQGYLPDGTLQFDSGTFAFDLDGQSGRFFVEMEQNGSDIDYAFGWQPVDGVALVHSDTETLAFLGDVRRVIVGADYNHDDLTVGHVVVQNEVTSIFSDDEELNAFTGETTVERVVRLVGENDLRVQTYTLASEMNEITDVMGSQRPADLVSLLRSAETVDQGILFDGLSAGIDFRDRRNLENASPSLVVDVAEEQLAAPLQPVDDDQARVNRVTVTREDGGSATQEDTDGPLGTSVIGTYDDSVTVSVASDQAVPRYAGWLVHRGTVEGYRYPAISVNLAASPDLITDWLSVAGVGPGSRIDVINPSAHASEHPIDDIQLQVQGYRQFISPYRWDVEINCAPFAPWRVAEVADESGDTGEFLARLDTDGSTLASSVSAGATSLSVASSGDVWTTTADDLPFDIEIEGLRVTVTAISGASSPQTFTVTGADVTKALTAGAEIKLYRPTAIGL